MTTLGRHLIAEFYDCDESVIDDLDAVGQHLRAAAAAVGATVVGEAFHRYAPQGVSGTLLIAESHMSVHTWPEAGYVAVDIFTCGGLDPRPGFKHLVGALGASSSRMHEILRGVEADVERGRKLVPDDVEIITRPISFTDSE
jgi:S-adenosylmethionine decarboxylase